MIIHKEEEGGGGGGTCERDDALGLDRVPRLVHKHMAEVSGFDAPCDKPDR